ncbi:hypothetical protein EON82_18480 [bacterium]|nr:MAG: hypothetical protein EON82_18480 [bacterium]
MDRPDVWLTLRQWTEEEGETDLPSVALTHPKRPEFVQAVESLFAQIQRPHVPSEAAVWFVHPEERRKIAIREPLVNPNWVARELWMRLVRAQSRG